MYYPVKPARSFVPVPHYPAHRRRELHPAAALSSYGFIIEALDSPDGSKTEAYVASAMSATQEKWCRAHGMQPYSYYSFEYYGQVGAIWLSQTWCQQMKFLYYVSQGRHKFRFTAAILEDSPKFNIELDIALSQDDRVYSAVGRLPDPRPPWPPYLLLGLHDDSDMDESSEDNEAFAIGS